MLFHTDLFDDFERLSPNLQGRITSDRLIKASWKSATSGAPKN